VNGKNQLSVRSVVINFPHEKTFLFLAAIIVLCSVAGIIACNKINNDKGIIVSDRDF
jgi:hypothetical protein